MDEVPQMNPAVEVRGIEHAYGDHVALRGVDFEVWPAEIFGLLGPNGGGKTTLFRILSTLLQPRRGRASILGCDVVRERGAVRRRLGVVFQSPALDGKLTVTENLRHQGHLYGLRGADLRRRIARALERFGLGERRRQIVEKLSGGLRRRVELAKCLLHDPQVLVLDEPSTGLDPGARREMWRHLEEIRREQGVTVLLTSHILEEVERCDRVAILDRGRLVTLGAPAELKEGIGGDVITITTEDPQRLSRAIAERFDLQPSVLDGSVRLESVGGAEVLRRIVEVFTEEIVSVTLAKPTLEDVFIHCTGHVFEDGGV
ncbi:MAG: ATP-binding cassette domain-containing protein [Candidatus Krumholzibacteriia bacterium]